MIHNKKELGEIILVISLVLLFIATFALTIYGLIHAAKLTFALIFLTGLAGVGVYFKKFHNQD